MRLRVSRKGFGRGYYEHFRQRGIISSDRASTGSIGREDTSDFGFKFSIASSKSAHMPLSQVLGTHFF